jgi:cellulase/cellobiase CelA1
VTANGATLSWTASTDNVGVAGYDVYRSPSTLLGQSATNSITLTGLTPATAYQVYVRARDAAGNASGQSAQGTFTTLTGGNPGGGGCTVTGTAQSQWSGGYVVSAKVTNTGTSAKTSWTVTFTLPAGHALTGSWNAAVTVSGQTVTAKNMSYNGTLAPNAGVEFGFQASRPGGNTSVPSGYTCS